ncbi:MAG: response regulator [Hyphomonadaceae bacterium]
MLKTLRPDERPIVLVDDDPALLQALVFEFQTDGYRAVGYPSAEALLAGVPAMAGCFVVDQNLPGVAGIDLIERLRAEGEGAPALLMTTHPSSSVRARAVRAGVEIVEKPLLGDALGRRIERLLAAR